MKKLSTVHIILVINIAIALILCVLYIYFSNTLSTMGVAQLGKAVQIQDAKRIISEEKNNEIKINSFFIQDGGQASFVSSLELRCREMSLVCNITSLEESPTGLDGIKILDIALSLSGSRDTIIVMLRELQSSQYPTLVYDISITEGGKDTENVETVQSNWTSSVSISVPVTSTNTL